MNNIPEGLMPFDYEEAIKRPEDVRTKDGQEVKIAMMFRGAHWPLIGWRKDKNGGWLTDMWRENGTNAFQSYYDLFLLPKKREVFQHIGKEGVQFTETFETLEDAIERRGRCLGPSGRVAILKITYTGDIPTACEICHIYAREGQAK